MIAYYATTDIQLINIVNLKVNVYPLDEGDLYIYNNGRIIPELITMIKDAGIFRRVNLIQVDDIVIPTNKKHHLFQNVIHLFKSRAYYYHQILINANNTLYSRLIINGFWLSSVYILLVLYSQNKKLRISLIDEGMGSYNQSKKELCTNFGVKSFSNIWYYFVVYSTFKNLAYYKNRVDDLYLYRPELYIDKENILVKKLPLINENNSICFNLLRKLSLNIDNSEYKLRNIFYFVQDQNNIPDQKVVLQTYLEILIQIIDSTKIIIKEHPNSVIGVFSQGELYQNTSLYVDKHLYLFEAMLLNINIDDKVFISRESSCLMYPKYMFDAEPYVIFTYKLYTEYYKKYHYMLDWYSTSLTSVYRNKDRVLVPENYEEFSKILSDVIQPFLHINM